MFVNEKQQGEVVTRPLDAIGQLLMAAADHIESYGWQRGTLGCYSTPTCALGAIYAATLDGPMNCATGAHDRLRRLLVNTPVVDWNDHPSTTKDIVVAKLREAASHK